MFLNTDIVGWGHGAQKVEKENDVCAHRDPEDRVTFSTQVEEGAVGQIKKRVYSSVSFKRI